MRIPNAGECEDAREVFEAALEYGEELPESKDEDSLIFHRSKAEAHKAQLCHCLDPPWSVSSPFEIPNKLIPTLLVFARGRLEEQPFAINDQEALKVIEEDEDEYEAYFDNFVRQLDLKEPDLRIRILPKERRYFFLRDSASLVRLLHELGVS